MRIRHILALALTVTAAAASFADAKPHRAHRAKPTKATQWMRDCIAERTSAGTSRIEATKICRSEQPDDDVAIAKRQLDAARLAAKLAKARERVAKAIEACEELVSVACEDSTERSTDNGECSDETLRPEFNRVCLAKEGK